MARPFKCRRIRFAPGVTYFKPAGIPMRSLEEIRVSLEEMEAVRLRDLEGLEQVECAEHMNVSRPTFQRVLASARRKIANALLSGKALRIEGGNYELASDTEAAITEEAGEPRMPTVATISLLNDELGLRSKRMKIAVVSDDGVTISQHFGRAPWYVVVTAENGRALSKEKRAKMGHNHFAAQGEAHGTGSGPHGYDAASQSRHAGMAETIADCQVLLAGGMGMGAYDSLKSYKIEPVVTDVKDIDQAVSLYLQGKLPNLRERLH